MLAQLDGLVSVGGGDKQSALPSELHRNFTAARHSSPITIPSVLMYETSGHN